MSISSSGPAGSKFKRYLNLTMYGCFQYHSRPSLHCPLWMLYQPTNESPAVTLPPHSRSVKEQQEDICRHSTRFHSSVLKALQWLLILLRTTFSNRLWPTGSTTPWPSVPSRLIFFYCSHMGLLVILRYSFHQSLAPGHTPSITSLNASMSLLKCHFFGGLSLASPVSIKEPRPSPTSILLGLWPGLPFLHSTDNCPKLLLAFVYLHLPMSSTGK